MCTQNFYVKKCLGKQKLSNPTPKDRNIGVAKLGTNQHKPNWTHNRTILNPTQSHHQSTGTHTKSSPSQPLIKPKPSPTSPTSWAWPDLKWKLYYIQTGWRISSSTQINFRCHVCCHAIDSSNFQIHRSSPGMKRGLSTAASVPMGLHNPEHKFTARQFQNRRLYPGMQHDLSTAAAYQHGLSAAEPSHDAKGTAGFPFSLAFFSVLRQLQCCIFLAQVCRGKCEKGTDILLVRLRTVRYND